MSSTEYRMSRRRSRNADGEASAPAIELPPLENVVPPASSPRLEARPGAGTLVTAPEAHTADLDTVDIDLPELAVPPVQGRVSTPRNTLPARELTPPQSFAQIAHTPVPPAPPPAAIAPPPPAVAVPAAPVPGARPGSQSQLARTPTEEMPAEEMAEVLGVGVSAQIMDNAATLPSLSGQAPAPPVATPEHKPSPIPAPPTDPCVMVAFGDHPIGVVHRGEEVELVLGGLRLKAPRAAAALLAEALLSPRS